MEFDELDRKQDWGPLWEHGLGQDGYTGTMGGYLEKVLKHHGMTARQELIWLDPIAGLDDAGDSWRTSSRPS
jgi:hypothetical protein